MKECPVEEKSAQYKQNWLNLLSWMEDIRYTKKFLSIDLSK